MITGAPMGEFRPPPSRSRARVIPGTENPQSQRRAAVATIVHRAQGREDLLELTAMLGLDVDQLRSGS